MARGLPTYRWLAEYYDDIFGPMHTPIDRARETLLKRILPRVRVACDLACGTGTSALALAARGIRTYGVDLSPRMCAIAREKVRRARAEVAVICADMRTFRLPERVELITCEYDALNHIPAKPDLRKVAKVVARALAPGGYFFFDVNNAEGFRRYWKGTFCIEKPGLMMLMRSGHSEDAQRAWTDVDWFVRDGSRWRRERERVEELCWSKAEIEQTFGDAGFAEIRMWDASRFFGKGTPVRRGCRSIYLTRRA